MALSKPSHGARDWDAPLNAALDALDSRVAQVEGASYITGKVQASAPAAPATGDVWVDTSSKIGSSCRVYKSGSQSIANGTFTGNAVVWDAEDHDDDAWHDASTNPSRLTVPSGVTRVLISAQAEFPFDPDGARGMRLLKNGVRICDLLGPAVATDDAPTRCILHSGVLTVVAGDYFEVAAFQSSGGPLTLGAASASSWLSILSVA